MVTAVVVVVAVAEAAAAVVVAVIVFSARCARRPLLSFNGLGSVDRMNPTQDYQNGTTSTLLMFLIG